MFAGAAPSIARVVVVGGGAAGFYSAVACAEAVVARAAAAGICRSGLPAAGVLILEQSSDVLHKVKISGGGRCNVTYGIRPAMGDVYPRGARLMEFLKSKHGPQDTIRWFEAHGVAMKQENDGRMFPVSNSSTSVVKCLKEAAENLGVQVQTGLKVTSASFDQSARSSGSPQFHLQALGCEGSTTDFRCERLIFCCGSAQKRSIRRLFTHFNVPFQDTAPSLFSVLFDNACAMDLQGLAGLAVPNASVRFLDDVPAPGVDDGCAPQLLGRGALLITHSGLSGPAILKLSSWGAFAFLKSAYHVTLEINWLPFVRDVHDVAQAIVAVPMGRPGAHPRPPVRKKTLGEVSPWTGHLPARLWKRLLERVEEKLPEAPWGRFRDPDLALDLATRLWPHLIHYKVTVKGRRPNKEEFVTAGGVDWRRDLDLDRMESITSPGVHFAGEVLDVDGVTGGYNFQACWTTGFIAGRAAAEVFFQ